MLGAATRCHVREGWPGRAAVVAGPNTPGHLAWPVDVPGGRRAAPAGPASPLATRNLTESTQRQRNSISFATID